MITDAERSLHPILSEDGLEVLLNNLLEMGYRLGMVAGFAQYPAKLVMGISLLVIDLDGPLKGRRSRGQIASLLVEQPEIVMRRCVGRIEGRRFEVLLEGLAGAGIVACSIDPATLQPLQSNGKRTGWISLLLLGTIPG